MASKFLPCPYFYHVEKPSVILTQYLPSCFTFFIYFTCKRLYPNHRIGIIGRGENPHEGFRNKLSHIRKHFGDSHNTIAPFLNLLIGHICTLILLLSICPYSSYIYTKIFPIISISPFPTGKGKKFTEI